MPADNAGAQFGSCCEALKDALTSDEFEPLFAVDEVGMLYMSVGLLMPRATTSPTWSTIQFFCPFCGTRLQTEQEVEAKAGTAAWSQPSGDASGPASARCQTRRV